MLRKNLLEILRWGLRLHGISHLIEVISAISEPKGTKTIVIVSHQSEYMDLADTVYSVENNRLKKKSER